MSLGSGPDKAVLPQGMLPLDHLWLVPLYASGQSMNQRAREICVIFKTHKALSNHKSSLRPCHWYCFFGGGCCCWKRLSSKLNFKPYIFLIYWQLVLLRYKICDFIFNVLFKRKTCVVLAFRRGMFPVWGMMDCPQTPRSVLPTLTYLSWR